MPSHVATFIGTPVGSGMSSNKVERVALEPKYKPGASKGVGNEDIEGEINYESIDKVEGYNAVKVNDLRKYMLENSSLLSYGARRVKIDTVYHQSKANEARIKESNLGIRKVEKFLKIRGVILVKPLNT